MVHEVSAGFDSINAREASYSFKLNLARRQHQSVRSNSGGLSDNADSAAAPMPAGQHCRQS
jgi:hypothetical protein